MNRRLRLAVALTVGVLGTVALPSAAGAAVSFTTMGADVSPFRPPGSTAYLGVFLSFGFDTYYTGDFNPVLKEATFHFDNDIAFDATGLPQCPLSSIQNKTTAQAIAACPGSKVGSGTALYNAGSLTGVVTAFNGTPSAGHPSVWVHFDIGPGSVFTAIGVLDTSSRGGDFGTQLDISNFPNTPGVALTHFFLTLDNLEPAPGHHYVSARCSDPDPFLEFAADFIYYDSTTGTAAARQYCQAPFNQFTLAKPKLNKKKGTAKLPVTVPGPGVLFLAGNGLATQSSNRASASVAVGGAGTINLLIKAKGGKKQKLNREGKVTLNVAITYTPTGGDARTQSVKVKLKKKL